MTKLYRSHKVQHAANQAKQDEILNLYPAWREALVTIQTIQLEKLYKGGKLGWLGKDYKPHGKLTARQWKDVTNQVNNDLKSWLARLTIGMRPVIYALEAEDEGKRKELYKLNLKHQWWGHEVLEPLVEELVKTNPPPNYDETRVMLMSYLTAPVREAKKSKRFENWVHVSLATRPGKPLNLPVVNNSYYEDQPGSPKLLQVRVSEDEKSLDFSIVKQSEITVPEPTGEVLGLDWGLVSLLTTSDGRRLGGKLYSWLLARDEELLTLEKALKKNHIPLKASKRYRRFQSRIRGYVENEVGRIVNLLGREELSEIVIEDLDFRGGGLSRRLNRIITRAGRSVLKQRLSELSEETGVKITMVHAPYSSQECSNCGFVSKRNRKSQRVFHCKFCGLRLNADVNAARVVKGRRSILSSSRYISREAIFEELDQRFNTHWGLSFDGFIERSTARRYSTARGLVPLN